MFFVPFLIVLLFPPVWLVWIVATFMFGDPVEEIQHVKHRQFLAPGGPDDPFAGEPFADD